MPVTQSWNIWVGEWNELATNTNIIKTKQRTIELVHILEDIL